MPQQWFTGTIHNGEWFRTKKDPRDIVADVVPKGWHFSHTSLQGDEAIASNIKVQVLAMKDALEGGSLDSIYRGIFQLAVENNEDYYPQPLLYDWDKKDKRHFFSDYKEWLQEKYNDELTVEREFALTEGALAISRRYDAELLNLLWHKWQEAGGRKPSLTKKATKPEVRQAAKLMYNRWLSGLLTVNYADEDSKTKTLYEFVMDKYGDPQLFAKNPLSAPFADKIDWNDSSALTEEFLGHFCKWAKTGLELI